MQTVEVCRNVSKTNDFELKVVNNIGLILDSFGIKYIENPNRFIFSCPIHGSNNYNSMVIYKRTGYSMCFTRDCLKQQGEGKGIFRFVSALLKTGLAGAYEYCDKVLKGIPSDYTLEEFQTESEERYRPAAIDRSLIIPQVNPNIDFYLKRGYTREILQKYDMFICQKKNNLLCGRIVIPVYNDEYTQAVGFLGRTLYPKCPSCKKYHLKTRPCPTFSFDIIKSEKWLNSKGMSRNKLLFNYWFAKEEVEKRGEVLLVESPGNVIKLAQAGINNTVAIFGTILSYEQIKKLENLGVKRVYLGLDKDGAGEAAAEKIAKQLSAFECIPLIPPSNDYGEMSTNEIQEFLYSQHFYF